MKPINLILLTVGGYLVYKWWQNQQAASATSTTGTQVVTSPTPTTLSLPGVSMSVPETTGMAQVVPTPASILPLNVVNNTTSSSGACSCCISGGNINKQVFVI
jgi:hypothetical protein